MYFNNYIWSVDNRRLSEKQESAGKHIPAEKYICYIITFRSIGLNFASLLNSKLFYRRKLRNEFQLKSLYKQESVYLVQQLN